MPKLVIIDGNSLLYRGFYAMRYLSTADGTPTNAVFSFTNMLLHILENERPDAIYAAFDPPGGTFRHEEMAEYKAQRKPMPEELKPQRQPARDVATAFRVPVVEIPGFEADDVCGTLARLGKERGYDVLIVTGDGDALQLVDDFNGPVRVMMTVKGVTDTVLYDEAAVEKRYGLTPAQIPDFKGLKGDSSDNLPGVPGIGEKGASKLLQQFKTVEELIEHAAELPDKTRIALQDNREIALQCKYMATIKTDVAMPEEVTLEPDYQATGPQFAALREIFTKLEFKQLIKRINDLERRWRRETGSAAQEEAPTVESRPSEVRHRVVESVDEATTLAAGLKSGLAAVHLHIDPPKASLMDAILQGIAFSNADEAVYVPATAISSELKEYLADPQSAKAVYDLKTVTGILDRHEITLAGCQFDALVSAYLINAGKAHYSLTELARDNAGIDLVADPDDAINPVLDEVSSIYAMREPMYERMEKDGLLKVLNEIELPLSPIIAHLEEAGVAVDTDLLIRVSETMKGQIAELEGEIWELAGEQFSIGSTKQLQEVLFEKLKLPSARKTKTGYSTASEVMEDLQAKGHDIAGKILQWRELSKLKSTYADSLPLLKNAKTGKIHTSLSQTVAATGRLSSSNPNLQNIPIRSAVGREIRKAFVAPPGRVLLSADYSQIELRIFASITKDPELVQAFQADEDIHARTARRIFEVPEGEPVTSDQRRQAKTINFAVIYGAGPFRVAAELGIPQSKASELIKAYLSNYTGVKTYFEKILEEARECGYVQTLFGRRRYVPDLLSGNYQFRQAAEREASNMPIQGTAADIMKLAMIKVDQDLRASGIDAVMILQVHDELLFECAPGDVNKLAALVRDCMENAYPMDVRLAVEVKSGHNWWQVTPVGEEDTIEAITELSPEPAAPSAPAETPIAPPADEEPRPKTNVQGVLF